MYHSKYIAHSPLKRLVLFPPTEDYFSAYSIDERTIMRINNKGKPCIEADITNGHRTPTIVNRQATASSTGKIVSHMSHLPRPDACLPDGGAAQDGLTSPRGLQTTDSGWSVPQDSLAISATGTR